MKNSILSQVLTQEARARLNTLRVAKPEKGQKNRSNVNSNGPDRATRRPHWRRRAHRTIRKNIWNHI